MLKITYRKIQPLNSGIELNKVIVLLDGVELPITIEKLTNDRGYRVKATINHVPSFSATVSTKDAAVLIAKGLVLDAIIETGIVQQMVSNKLAEVKEQLKAEQRAEQPTESKPKVKLQWKHFRGKYRAYRMDETHCMMTFENLRHLTNWANKYSDQYQFVTPIPQDLPKSK